MKVGDYVRTDDGFIGKITSIESNERIHLFQKSISTDNYKWLDLVLEENIIKSSPNIIDLIEVGDYVNGFKVDEIDEKGIYNYNSYDGWRINIASCNDDIKSIVTKEQFESMEYKIGE